MKEDDEQRQLLRRLKRLATDAGFSVRRNGLGYELSFHGKYRDFDVRCTLGSGWLRMASYILQLPPAGATRAKLLERMMELNLEMPLAKFTKADDVLYLEVEYREEHVDADVFEKLATLVRELAEHHYPQIFRIVSAHDALQSLEDAFQRTGTASE
jgi:hypothetical protein